MRFTVIDVEQRSDEWYSARLGCVTGSKAHCVTAKIKSGEAAARRDYRMDLAIERITGVPTEKTEFNSRDVERGVTHEPDALAMYEAQSGEVLTRTGFLKMVDFMAGCSLDGDINSFRGIVEVKCPRPATHVEYIRTKRIPHPYSVQVVHNLWITGAEFCDFISYCAQMPEGLQYLCIRHERDEVVIKDYETLLTKFLAEVESEAEDLLKMRAA